MPTIYVLSKNKQNKYIRSIYINPSKFSILTAEKKSLYNTMKIYVDTKTFNCLFRHFYES